MAEESASAALMRMVVRSVLPYPDPLRRRRVRARAAALVACSPWPGERADGPDIAQLALLRLLWLQRETHRAAHAGLSESVALLARTAIETCIVGLYCLVTADARAHLNDQNAYQLRAMLRYLPEEFFSQQFRDRLVASVGVPSAKPSSWDMARAVDEASHNHVAGSLYQAYYAPLSALYAHGGGTSLLRHVDRKHQATMHPDKPWFHRSALHITDSCVALLASKIAAAADADTAIFEAYHETHRRRTITPVASMGGRALPSVIRWRAVPNSVRAGRRLKRYLAGEASATDTPADREAKIRAEVGKCFEPVEPMMGADIIGMFIDEFVDHARRHPPIP